MPKPRTKSVKMVALCQWFESTWLTGRLAVQGKPRQPKPSLSLGRGRRGHRFGVHHIEGMTSYLC
jgi:hypothetical protein